VNKLWESDLVHVWETGYTKLLEALETMADNLMEYNGGKMKNVRFN
jgi:hypothetical protein